ncbi:DNA/RNA polymerases superfamily protein [Gossypium australe]|uniref:DNA/RNA polymerases superfamily protein n=1 Tax=Gossypium australe TaxID=47621 RepID=A0A5B6VL34_9ROSI|nr:DNA/RNA polymerases superfamily protein [Gossypium australe]
MTYNKEPIRILSREVKQLRNKSIALMKVIWKRHGVEEATLFNCTGCHYLLFLIEIQDLRRDFGRNYKKLWFSIEHKDGIVRSFVWSQMLNSIVLIHEVDLIRETEEKIGDKVFLKVSSWKIILRFSRKGKLSPRFIRPYEIEIQPDMTYNKEPIRILSREVKQLRNKSIALMKVIWKRHGVEEATWGPEEAIRN